MEFNLDVDISVEGRDNLGEAPFWSEAKQELLWVDINAGLFHVLDTNSRIKETTQVGPPVSFAIPRLSGGFVFGARDGILLQDLDGTRRYAARIESGDADIRFNEGKCDPAGRLWAGTMSTSRRKGVASLYRLDLYDQFIQVVEGMTISNGMSWSLSNQLMYMIDSTTQQIDVFDYEIETGNVFNRRPFVRIDIGDGLPDGMTIDCEGGVWVCLFGGGALRRYSALGELDFVAKLPVTNPTSLAFGGADLGDLFITTARHRLNEEQLSSEPLAGAILQMRPGIKGLSGQMFAG